MQPVSSSPSSTREERLLVTANFGELMSAVADRCPGGKLPDTYLVIDLETTGLPDHGREEYVTQFGYAAVTDRKIADSHASLLKTPPGWIHPEASRVTGITDEMIQRDGEDPAAFYEKLIKIFALYRGKSMFVGHNVYGFDCPFLEADFEHHGHDFKFDDSESIDTGMIFKASQLFLAPADNETLGQFYRRVGNVRSRVKWNLAFAIRRLGLDMKFGLDLSKAHSADVDCRFTHILFEELRSRAGI